MSIFNKDKETVNLYKRENKKLRKDLAQAKAELDAIYDFKNKYQELITQVKEQQKHYENLNSRYENLIADCQAQLDQIMNQ